MTQVAYVSSSFSVALDGIQLKFKFDNTTLPNLVYVNQTNCTVNPCRTNPVMVEFGDNKGIVTVDYTKCTSPNYTGQPRSTWINSVLAL